MIVKNYHFSYHYHSKMDLLSDIEGYSSDEDLQDDASLSDASWLSSSSLSNPDYLAMLGLSHEDTIRSQQTTFDANRSISSLGSSFFQLDLSDSITTE